MSIEEAASWVDAQIADETKANENTDSNTLEDFKTNTIVSCPACGYGIPEPGNAWVCMACGHQN